MSVRKEKCYIFYSDTASIYVNLKKMPTWEAARSKRIAIVEALTQAETQTMSRLEVKARGNCEKGMANNDISRRTTDVLVIFIDTGKLTKGH